MDYAQYGLTATDAKAADHDKGIVAGPNGGFYSIDGFKREQKEGLDSDQGDVFSGGLEKAAKSAGFDPTTFNTATDVENALKAIGSGTKKSEPIEFDPQTMEMSPEYAHAKARVDQYKEDVFSGRTGRDLFGTPDDASNFLDRYKIKLGERLENGNYRPPKLKDVKKESGID